MENQILDACVDWVNQSTVYVNDYLGSDVQMLERLILDFTRTFDQHKAGDGMGCTVYGTVHDKHDTERIETLDPSEERDDAVVNRGASRKNWRSLNGVLLMFYNKWYIKGRALSKGVENMKKTIMWWTLILTGSSKINRVATKARSDKMAVVVKSWPWHAFVFKGFDDNWKSSDGKYTWAFVAKNSSLSFPEFYVPYDLIDCLFSTIEIYTDETTARALRDVNDRAMIQYAVDVGITNWEDLEMLATRWQVAVMLWRLDFPWEDYDKALELAKEKWIRNGERAEDPIIREELMIMCGRMLTEEKLWDEWYISLAIEKNITNGNNRSEKATRKDVILMVARIKKTLYS